jgi:hypothetical protein
MSHTVDFCTISAATTRTAEQSVADGVAKCLRPCAPATTQCEPIARGRLRSHGSLRPRASLRPVWTLALQWLPQDKGPNMKETLASGTRAESTGSCQAMSVPSVR